MLNSVKLIRQLNVLLNSVLGAKCTGHKPGAAGKLGWHYWRWRRAGGGVAGRGGGFPCPPAGGDTVTLPRSEGALRQAAQGRNRNCVRSVRKRALDEFVLNLKVL